VRAALAIASLALCMPAWAVPPDIKCNDGGTMLEMAACARDDFDAADRELNQVYRKLMSAGAKEPVFIASLRGAQKAWLAFRDAELESRFACENQDHRTCWGSMITLDWPAYKTQLTRERTRQLGKLLEERFPDRSRGPRAQ
jgi:uncharacterized protein YecT (DUF1311 family)